MSFQPHLLRRARQTSGLFCLILASAVGACTCQDKLEDLKGTLLVTPATYDFGSISPGDSAETSFQVKNVGRGTFTVESITLLMADSSVVISDVFTLDCNAKPRTGPDLMLLQSGDCAEFTVRYAPTSSSAMSNTIVITSENATNPTVKVPITGEAPAAKLCVTPASLSFGSVPVGTTKTLPVTFTNCGGVNYELTQLAFANAGASVFTSPATGMSGALPPLPYPFAVGATLTVNVTYAPVAAQSDTDSLIAIAGIADTIYQRVTVPITGEGAATGCGTTTNLTPTAVITVLNGPTVVDAATTVFSPLTQVKLDASDSTVPAGSGETVTTYSWTLMSQPSGSATSLTNADKEEAGLYMEVIGEYVVQLIVGTNTGAMSCPVTVTLQVNSTAGIHVQLTWPESYGDVDLHYIGPGGSFYETTPYEGDLDWMYSWATAVGPVTPTPNCGGGLGSCAALNPHWGGSPIGVSPGPTTAGDASLDVDQRWGNGPENVTQDMPFDGDYTVAAHYYCSYKNEEPVGQNYGPITAVIKVFVRGVLQWTGQMPGMTDNQVWDAATISVTNNGDTVTVTPLTTPLFDATGEGCASGL